MFGQRWPGGQSSSVPRLDGQNLPAEQSLHSVDPVEV